MRRIATAVDMDELPRPPGAETKPSPPVAKHDELVTKHSYSSGQTPPNLDTTRQGEQPSENANTFATPTPKDADKLPQAPPALPKFFTNPERMEWAVERDITPDSRVDNVVIKRFNLSQASSAPKEPDEPTEDENALGCSEAPKSLDGGQGIGPQEMDWIVDMCNGNPVPKHRCQAILLAIRNIRGTQIHQTLIESINGCDNMIAKFLDEAEREASTDNTNTAVSGF